MEKFGSHCTDFLEILYLSIFRKFAENIQVSLKSDSTVHDNMSLGWSEDENITDRSCKENQNTFYVQQIV
jgi:hypothetical protein